MVKLFDTTYISVDLAHHKIFHAKVGKGGKMQYFHHLPFSFVLARLAEYASLHTFSTLCDDSYIFVTIPLFRVRSSRCRWTRYSECSNRIPIHSS